jgi:tRNA pseudouridine38-40 synthase
MKRFRFNVCYDGTNYSGWQTQLNFPTIQETIEKVLQRITGQKTCITGSGRTDAGVHALCQTAAFTTDSPQDAAVFMRAMNGFLPQDIRILKVEETNLDFHPIHDAVSKRYRYLINDSRPSCPFLRQYAWIYRRELDAEAMQEAAQYLLGEHDFVCFQTLGSPRKTTVRTISDAVVKRLKIQETVCPQTILSGLGHPPLIFIEVEATGFLYNMMRAISGTLVMFGLKKMKPEQMKEIIESKDRSKAGQVAPPQGLFLQYAVYPAEKYLQH